MATCPACGKVVPSQYINCPACGYNLPRLEPYRVPPASTAAPGPEVTTALGRLKWALVLSAIGILLSQTPGIGSLGSLISLAGLVILVIVWRGFGQSGLPGRPRYGETMVVLILAFILSIGVAIIGVVSIAGQIGQDTMLGENTQSIISDAVTGTAIMGIVLLVIGAAGQIASGLSLRRLGQDLKESRLGVSGVLFIVSLLISSVASIGVMVGLENGAFQGFIESAVNGQGGSVQLSLYSFLFSGAFVYYGVAYVVGLVLYLVATCLGYFGATRALSSIYSNSTTAR